VSYIKNALSPTRVNRVIIDQSGKRARVLVPEDQLSIAIGKGGQNVRLASKLTGYELDVEADKASVPEQAEAKPANVVESVKPTKLKRKSELEDSLLKTIEEHGE